MPKWLHGFEITRDWPFTTNNTETISINTKTIRPHKIKSRVSREQDCGFKVYHT